ncbi:MAG: FixH family protein [Deltaproteobacteria bacterium]|nr:FixH family protein [Deltaproteobacteria bacterium]
MEKKKNYWPLAIAASLGVVFLVNFFFLYMAVKSDDGLTDKNYYEKGLLYDSQLKNRKELGWKIELSMGSEQDSNRKIYVTVTDKEGRPLKDASVKLVLMRPATDKYDRVLNLTSAKGQYIGDIAIPLGGWWDLKISAGQGRLEMEETFRIKV